MASKKGDAVPTVRLAIRGTERTVPALRLTVGSRRPEQQAQALAPTVRLAIGGPEQACARGLAPKAGRLPGVLASYHYLKDWLSIEKQCAIRDWVLDSGAFSAHSLGVTIELRAYMETALELLATDPRLTEVFALDVIGDAEAGRRNAEKMQEAGIPVIPCYHVGEPKELLRYYCKHWPKVALGGAVGYKRKLAWARLCFKEVWPHRLHGFGYGGVADIMALPWHSVDASNWEIGPTKFGMWLAYGQDGKRVPMSVRGSKQNLQCEVEHYLRVEERAAKKWAARYRELEDVK